MRQGFSLTSTFFGTSSYHGSTCHSLRARPVIGLVIPLWFNARKDSRGRHSAGVLAEPLR